TSSAALSTSLNWIRIARRRLTDAGSVRWPRLRSAASLSPRSDWSCASKLMSLSPAKGLVSCGISGLLQVQLGARRIWLDAVAGLLLCFYEFDSRKLFVQLTYKFCPKGNLVFMHPLFKFISKGKGG